MVGKLCYSNHSCSKHAYVNLMKFNKDKCKILHLGQGSSQYQYRLGDEFIDSSPTEKDLGILVDEKMNMSWKCPLRAQKAWAVMSTYSPESCILGCIKSNVASRSREVILPVYSTLMRPHLESCTQLWGPQYQKEVDL